MDNKKRKRYNVNQRYSGYATNANQTQTRLTKKKRRDLPLLTVKEALAIVDEADRDDQERNDKQTKEGGSSSKGVKRGRNWMHSNFSTQRDTQFIRELVLKQIASMTSLVPSNEHQQQQEPPSDANLPTNDLLELQNMLQDPERVVTKEELEAMFLERHSEKWTAKEKGKLVELVREQERQRDLHPPDLPSILQDRKECRHTNMFSGLTRVSANLADLADL